MINDTGSNAPNNIPWNEQATDELMAMALHAMVSRIKDRQSVTVTDKNLRHARLYGNAEIMGLKPFNYTNAISDRILSLNVVQAAIDTACARIAKTKPRPQFVTYDGDYRLKNEAKKLQMYVDGTFYENHGYQLFQR